MISNFVKNKKDNKGITLISLVITIVIMLILTGITINLLFGENGIITKTKMAKKAFLGEDARQVVEDRVNAYLAEYGSKGELSLFDFWAMYNSSELLDASGNSTGQTNPDYDPNFVIYLFKEEAAVGFTPTIQAYDRNTQYTSAVGFTPTIQAYDRNTQYTSAVVIYKGYQATVNKNLTVAKKVTAVDDLTEAQISKLENKQVYTISPTGWAREKTITPKTIEGSELYIDASGSMALWNSPVVVSENKTLNYEVRQSGTKMDEGEIVIDKIDKVNPDVGGFTVTVENGTEPNKYNVVLSVVVTDALSGYSNVTFKHRTIGGQWRETVVTETTMHGQTAGATEKTVTATLQNLTEGRYEFMAVVYDVAGNSDETEVIQKSIVALATTNTKLGTSDFKYNNPVIPKGFAKNASGASWNVIPDPDDNTKTIVEGWNDGLVIEDENENEFVWIPVKDGIGTDGAYSDETTVQYKRWANSYTSYDESPTGSIPSSVDDQNAQIQAYGGFYIARYEAGMPDNLTSTFKNFNTDNATYSVSSNTNNKATYDNGTKTYKPVSKKGAQPWNYMSWTNANTVSQSMINTSNVGFTDGVKTGLLTGRMWDTTMRWLKTCGYDVDSNQTKTWGNYYDLNYTASLYNGIVRWSTLDANIQGWTKSTSDKTKNNNSILYTGTGLNENSVSKNIYDLSGNLWEYTTERDKTTYSGTYRWAIRGGNAANNSYDCPAVKYAVGIGGKYYEGFRVALYVAVPNN